MSLDKFFQIGTWVGNAFISENLMGGVFFFLLLVCGVSLEAWRKARRRTVKFVVCVRLEWSHRNLLPTHESCGWKRFLPRVPGLTQRQAPEPPTAESHREPGAVADVMGDSHSQVWRDDSVSKGVYHSCRGPEFNTHIKAHNCLQLQAPRPSDTLFHTHVHTPHHRIYAYN